ncbi:unnamed protein product [Amoebophrya sp. A120]|nr:unnamed protein product [Amoebophrya sp. A120]|eukprot:GSA120T00024636001.1
MVLGGLSHQISTAFASLPAWRSRGSEHYATSTSHESPSRFGEDELLRLPDTGSSGSSSSSSSRKTSSANWWMLPGAANLGSKTGSRPHSLSSFHGLDSGVVQPRTRATSSLQRTSESDCTPVMKRDKHTQSSTLHPNRNPGDSHSKTSFVEAGLMGKEHHHEEHDHGEGHENDHDKKDHHGNKTEPQDPKLRAAEVKAAARSAFRVAFIGFMAASSEWMSAYVGYQMDIVLDEEDSKAEDAKDRVMEARRAAGPAPQMMR